ncbi:MAG TPA: hypothetical protein VGI39_38245 [Polyangiaceae bacterium]|jgi:Cys-rich repeat protein
MRFFLVLLVSSLGVALAGACGGSSGNGSIAAGSVCATAGACANKCDPTLGCVDCLTDADCGGATKFCSAGTCVACRTNADCGVSAPACWPGDHRCHASCSAAGSNGCNGAEPYCDSSSGACEECRTSADCQTGAPICNAETHACAQCATDKDCPQSRPRCLPTGECRQCLGNSDCGGSTPVCQANLLVCIAGCSSDANCKAPFPRCDIAHDICVPCLVSADCAPTQKCQNEVCVAN